ncbi:ABC transporter ATP-binding protein [Clostridium estertheticum]|uniref:ABC transporter ATP-binding protein n=1 Tax=Clostridium estertheticum TaxID=238834 RepID=UPI0013E92E20|nr:ABC transporter ATP-binding protein [Clostridium estertheticum]MBZ9688520.1 ABC transporter ATP-binding protein [Clostridium estertheticum]
MNNAIVVNKLCKDYGDFSLNNISFSLPTGYIMGFVGQNGSGKTTTIRLILNMTARNNGNIRIFEMDNILEEQKIKQGIAVVLDDIFFVENWKVYEVEKAVKGFYDNWDSTLFHQYLNSFNLPINKKVKDLSRGMKMKLMLAVAMSHNAKLLILDEPTSGLDPVARDELLEILSAYISDGQRSVLFSTHITSDLEKIADYITLIDKGNIFYTGTKDDLLESFYVIKGGLDELTNQIQEKIIGVTTHNTGFTGLMPASEVKDLSKNIIVEISTIDEILVYISKEDKKHGQHY